MEEKYSVTTEFNLKNRIDMARVFMGRAYGGFLLVAGAVVCFNYYLITSGQGAPGDEKKTISLFALMVVWAFVPVIAGFIWDKFSKVRRQSVTITMEGLTAESEKGSFTLEPKRFYTVVDKGAYIRLGPLKETVIISREAAGEDYESLLRFIWKVKGSGEDKL